jgi:hypothetical protein
MPEETKDAPVVDDAGTEAPPVPAVSTSSAHESSAGPGIDAEALARQVAESVRAEIEKDLDDRVDARFKSGKDRRFAKVDEIYDWVKKSGGDVTKIEGDLTISELRSRLEAVEQGRDVGTSPATAPQGTIQAETEDLLKSIKDELGVDFTREELESLSKSKVFTSNAAWYAELSKSAVKKAKSGAVTPAATVGASGSVAATGDKDYDELAAELAQLQSQGSSPENMKRRREILLEMGSEMKDVSRGLF